MKSNFIGYFKQYIKLTSNQNYNHKKGTSIKFLFSK